jgi:mono/diheme cytochrome c family protein
MLKRFLSCLVCAVAAVRILALQSTREPWRAPAEARALRRPEPADAKSVERGKRTFTGQCRPCHGKAGKGDGAMADSLRITPADLSNRQRMEAQQDGELFWKISKGRDPMPSFERKLPANERWDVIAYVRTLAQ